MRVESIKALAFGPLSGAALEFAPAMTVIHGPNESGKSTWHAAIYAGICGMRKAKGKPKKEDSHFGDLHRPWGGNAWEVAAIVALDDGRRIELSHDLEGGVDCRAVELGRGLDVSGDVIADGAPDGSRWLGLNRRSFLATACVRQADLLGVLEDPELLQSHLQRLADTAGTDATASAAIEALKQFWREHVGQDWQHVKKPLRLTKARVSEAEAALDRAKREHSEFLSLCGRAQEASERADRAARTLKTLEAAQSVRQAETAEARLSKARELSERFPEGRPTPVAEDDQLAQEVAAALRAWEERPEPVLLTGKTAQQLREEIDSLPERESADAEPAARLIAARDRWYPVAAGASLLVGAVSAFASGRPLIGSPVLLAGLIVLGWSIHGRAKRAKIRNLAEAEDLYALARKPDLLEQLRLRKIAEASVTDAVRLQESARRSLQEVATRCGVSAPADEGLAGGLKRWQRIRSQALTEHESAQSEWAQLESLIDGGDISDLEADADRLRSRADRLAADTNEDELRAAMAENPQALLDDLRAEADAARSEAAALEGQVEQLGRKVPSVPDAEEELAEAQRELDRVKDLDKTLGTTLDFLERAQDRVHRDVAPVLAETVQRWLREITTKRYGEVAVDPETLKVRVRTDRGQWRDAAFLSHGTAEQIYLLLRMALAEHLTKKDGVCPLILDDITAQWDTERTDAVLNILHAISRERQVILFSQEADVFAWAQANLREPEDRLIPLRRIPVDA